MKIYEFEILKDKPALYHPGMDLVIISDVHLGLEGSMTSKGSYIPKFQLDEMEDEIEDMKQETGADRILVNGDLKNEFSISYAEKREVAEFVEHLQELFEEVILVRGNHDTGIEHVVEEKGLEMVDRHKEQGVLFVHGHEEIEEDFEVLVLGHEHPALALRDEVGVKEKVPCFLYGETENGKVIVMPPYSTISNGTEINQVPRDELLTPFLRENGVEGLKAVGISREAGVLEFPEVEKI